MQDVMSIGFSRVLAFPAEQTILANKLFSAEQAKAYLTELESLPKPPQLSQTLDGGERYFSLDWDICLSRDGLDKKLRSLEFFNPDPSIVLPDLDLDFDEYLRLTTQDQNAIVKAMALPWPQRRPALIDAGVKDGDSPSSDDDQPGALPRQRILKLLATTSDKDKKILTQKIHKIANEASILSVEVYALDEQSATREDLTRIGLALEIYAEKGQYPAKLELLEPKYLRKVPPDRFVDKPLIYRPSEKDHPLVYSVGLNMKDDQGKNENKLDDIGLEVK